MTKDIICPMCSKPLLADDSWVCFGQGAIQHGQYIHHECFMKALAVRIETAAWALMMTQQPRPGAQGEEGMGHDNDSTG